MSSGATPGSEAAGNALYRLPLFTVFPYNILGPALGAARVALEAVIEDICGRRTMTGANLAQLGTVHEQVGRATATLEAAEALIDRMRTDILRRAARDDGFPVADRALFRLNLGWVAQSCCAAVDALLPLTGGRGLEAAHPVQRAWRDVHAVAKHIRLAWDVQTGQYGAALFGSGVLDPKL